MIRTHHGRAGLVLAAAFAVLPALAAAQAAPVSVERDADCNSDWGRDREQYCEVREYRLGALDRLEVNAGPNGGIDVAGWDRDEIRLLARVHASSRDDDPRALAEAVRIRTGSTITADGPRTGRRDHWSVSYELQVPRRTALRLSANNGGIGLAELTGAVDASTTNGGIHFVGGAGDIRGRTTNGGLDVELLGRSWDGRGLDLQTTNGGIVVRVPDGYSAELETGTVNGGLDFEIPVMVQGRIDRRIRTTLGEGGAPIRLITTNGGVSVRR